MRRQRGSDVAGHEHRAGLLGEQGARERGRRRLAVGARDRDRLRLEGAPAELELADDRDAAGARRSQLIAVERHTGAHDDEVGAVEGAPRFPAREEADAQRLQLGGHAAESFQRLQVGAGHLRAGRPEEPRRGDAAPRESHDRHPSPGDSVQVRPPPRHHVDLIPLRDHCIDIREAGAVGGWPERGAAWLRCIDIREAGAVGGWPFERGLRPRNRSWGRLGGGPRGRSPSVRGPLRRGGWPETRCGSVPFRMSLFIPLAGGVISV